MGTMVSTTIMVSTTTVAATTLAATAVDNATTTAKMMEVAVCPTEAAGSTAPTHLEVVSRPILAARVPGFPPGASSAATSAVAGGAPNSRRMSEGDRDFQLSTKLTQPSQLLVQFLLCCKYTF